MLTDCADIDQQILAARLTRDTNAATARCARINGSPMVASLATSRAKYASRQIDRLLDKRLLQKLNQIW